MKLNQFFGLDKRHSSVGDVRMADFKVDPYYTSSQDKLSSLGSDILAGKLPDYYKPIGDFNSPEFQNMLASVSKNIQKGVLNQSALTGTSRSGTSATATANALGDVIPGLSFQDYSRAMEGRKGLLDFGASTLSGVRSAGQAQGAQENSYNVNKANFDLGKAEYADNWRNSNINNNIKGITDIMAGVNGGLGGFFDAKGKNGADPSAGDKAAGGLGGFIKGYGGQGGGDTEGLMQLFKMLAMGGI